MTFQESFNAFMQSSFEEAVVSSTKASWAGDGYSVELFETGEFRVLWNKQIGNLYESPGIILPVPVLGDEDWDEDPSIRFFDNAEEEMRNIFQQAIADIKQYESAIV